MGWERWKRPSVVAGMILVSFLVGLELGFSAALNSLAKQGMRQIIQQHATTPCRN